MRRHDFDPSKLRDADASSFAEWQTRAVAATERAVRTAEDGKPELDDSVWGDLKRWLLKKVFGGKCAYCEGKFDAQTHGAADHYRPKGAVSVRSNGKSERLRRGGVEHRGYFWIAHSWWNLIPCCDRCNSGSGKGDQFPVAGWHVFGPEEVDDPADVDELDAIEQPLLLHPYRDNPADHLVFGAQGVVAARDSSERGRATIALCNLDRAELAEERKEQQAAAVTA